MDQDFATLHIKIRLFSAIKSGFVLFFDVFNVRRAMTCRRVTGYKPQIEKMVHVWGLNECGMAVRA